LHEKIPKFQVDPMNTLDITLPVNKNYEWTPLLASTERQNHTSKIIDISTVSHQIKQINMTQLSTDSTQDQNEIDQNSVQVHF